MKKTIRVVKTFKIVKRSCSLNRYYRVDFSRLSTAWMVDIGSMSSKEAIFYQIVYIKWSVFYGKIIELKEKG